MFLWDTFFRRVAPLACTRLHLYSTRAANPGVGRRLKIFKQGNPSLTNAKMTEEEFDDSEVDVMDGNLVGEYEREYRKISKRIAYDRVERKYFEKVASPNFLMWAEKEQIRQLHHSEPDRWTFEALSQCFPATPDVIKKIVEAQWKLKTPEAVMKHDQKVIANWKALTTKKIQVAPRTAEHLSKFTAREHLLSKKESKDLATLEDQRMATNDKLIPTKCTQFIDIIKKYKPGANSANSKIKLSLPEEGGCSSAPSETYVMGGRVPRPLNKDQYTLSEMKKSGVLSKQPEELPEENSSPSAARNDRKLKGIVNPLSENTFSIPRYPKPTSTIKEPNDDPIEETPMKITIPRDKWKKGAVYKVNNCFYADDGEFLYKI